MLKIPLRNLLFAGQKRFLATPATLSPPPPQRLPSPSVECLIDPCGFSLESALSKSLKPHSNWKNVGKHALVINCLKSHGFNDTHIIKLVEKRPNVLQCDVEATLNPKLKFLTENGLTGKHLTKLIVTDPLILARSLDSRIKPSFKVLRQYLESIPDMMKALNRAPRLLSSNLERVLQPNVEFLVDEGISADRVSKLLVARPRVLLQKREMIASLFKAVKNMGVSPKDSIFIRGIQVLSHMSEATWKNKMELFKSLGWSEGDLLRTFRVAPFCFAYSEKKIRSQMDFLLNTVNAEQKTVIAFPKILTYSLDKRLRPRYEVLKVLLSKKLIREDIKILWLLDLSDKKFLDTYVTKHLDKVPSLLDVYKGNVEQSTSSSGPGKLDA
ncbi:hypothetical protein SLE2022_111850 [Rubroshorea leprosula]